MPDFSLYDFLERTAHTSPATAGFSFGGGQATVPYLIDPTSTPLEEVIPFLLGSVSVYDADSDHFGKLQRVLPKAHPRHPWLFCDRIESITGIGTWQIGDSLEIYEAEPLIYAYADYEILQLNVGFAPRPYVVAPDEAIGTQDVTYYEETGADDEDPLIVTVPEEYRRFTDYEIIPGVDIASAQHGQMYLRTTDDSFTNNKKAASGFPQIRVPKALVRFTWYQVPFSYVDNEFSWITRGIGKINQHDWLRWEAGSLLYAGADIRRYTPPAPEKTLVLGTTTFSSDKVCDITFNFEWTDREASGTPPTPARSNWLAAGHNLMPNIAGNRGFYYATSTSGDDSDQDEWYPTYLSFPFEFLFVNPDALAAV